LYKTFPSAKIQFSSEFSIQYVGKGVPFMCVCVCGCESLISHSIAFWAYIFN